MAHNTTPPRTPERTNLATTPQSRKRSPTSPRTPDSPRSVSPRNPQNALWMQELQRRTFLHHLNKWSLSHDSSPYYHGRISICNKSRFNDNYQLAKSVNCVLHHADGVGVGKWIVVRLFAPKEGSGKYRLVVRNGAGWVTAREYFSQEYFNLCRTQNSPRRSLGLPTMGHLQLTNLPLEPIPDAVIIRPLFHHFGRLPLELQQLILGFSIGKREMYRPGQAQFVTRSSFLDERSVVAANISLRTVFSISKSLSQHLISWIYKTTTFHFGTASFMSFLWQSGPTNRAYINKVTLAFDDSTVGASLHCLRWFAPDPIFTLFKPPMATRPPALQYLWRCQFRDLLKELHLSVLTIELHGVPAADTSFVARTVVQCFGSVGKTRFTSSGVQVDVDDERLAALKKAETWTELCKDAFTRFKKEPYHFDARVRMMSAEALCWEMKSRSDFFDNKTTQTWRGHYHNG